MAGKPTIRVFISSPFDVRPERLKAEQIVARLDREFSYHFAIQPVLWEREPLVATHHFQDEHNLLPPHETDIVVVVLWSRLGVPLPEDKFRGALSGRAVTGTEWEFEDALASAREKQVPDLLFYRKTAPSTADLSDRKVLQERLEQLDLVEDFIQRWFRSADNKSLLAASHSFATTSEFEGMLYEHLKSLLERRASPKARGLAIRWHEEPFRGLQSFEYEHASIFFGRTRARNEIRELLAHLDASGQAFVLVLGASGSGKSSLVKAGLLPDLMLPGMVGRVGLVRWALMRPSDIHSDGNQDPTSILANAILSAPALPELVELQYTCERLWQLMRDAPNQAAFPIRQGLAVAGRKAELTEIAESRLAIIVDQFEEIFTLKGIEDRSRESFLAALAVLARSGLVWVVATMRSDFYERPEVVTSLETLGNQENCYRLLAPNDAELGQIIREPALQAGLRFEHDSRSGLSLDDAILQSATKNRGLPLLSFVLQQLWERRSKHGELLFGAYNKLGGFEGALGLRAEEIFAALPKEIRGALPRILRALITVSQGPQGTASARPAPLDRFPEGSDERCLVDAFAAANARLLVIDGADANADGRQVRVAHEALLSHWGRAREWIVERLNDLQLEERLEADALRWHAATGHKQSLLRPPGLLLTEANDLLARCRDDLSPTAIKFVEMSEAVRMKQHGARVLAVTALAMVIALLAYTGWVYRSHLERNLRVLADDWFPSGFSEKDLRPKSTFNDCASCPTMIVLPAAPVAEDFDAYIPAPFAVSKYEITFDEWDACVAHRACPSEPNVAAALWGRGNLPVINVSWQDAQKYVSWISKQTKKNYRLLTNAEWEYAARAATKTAYSWGDDIGVNNANCVRCGSGSKAGQTTPVGQFPPNAFGLYDMLGNVWEWVQDCYGGSEARLSLDVREPGLARLCELHILRGGSWLTAPEDMTVASTAWGNDFYRAKDVGFRVARTISQSRQDGPRGIASP